MRFGQKISFFAREENKKYLDWKSIVILHKYLTRFGDIKPRRYTSNTISRQKKVRRCIIRARELGVLEYLK
jgi:ribosomal protein S18